MVLSSDMDWHGSQWIGANGAAISGSADDFMLIERVDAGHYQSMRLRRELEVKPKLRQATLCVCGLGQYELTIDGSRVGEDLLTPGWTNYKKTLVCWKMANEKYPDFKHKKTHEALWLED
ncbi:unnamed protein product [Sphagnum jensenii]|uniref:Bacterial alpha-L-rhamnosidase N-terminal domain-containing protein n=1 Tax=Sphagnum jensenii TaxID=128206 RepID=A0ABP0WII6_9BRYO